MGHCCESSTADKQDELKTSNSTIDRRRSEPATPDIKAETFKRGDSLQGSPLSQGSSRAQPAYFCKRGTNEIIKVEKRGESKTLERINASVSSDDWHSVQVYRQDLGGHCLFQVREGTPGCRWMDKNGRVTEERAQNTSSTNFSLCNMNDEFIFLVGGGSAERFDVSKRIWEALPNMKKSRHGAASCALNG